MTFPRMLLAALAATTLIACGKKTEDSGAASSTSRKAASVEAASPLETGFQLKDSEPVDIDAFFALLPEKSRPSYESADFDAKLGATVITNLRFADADDGEGVIVERAEFYGVDMGAIDRIRNAKNAKADAPFETVFQKVRFFNVKSEGFQDKSAAVDLSIEGVEFDGLKIRRGGFKGDGVGDEDARFINAVNLAGLYLQNFSFTTRSDEVPAVAFKAADLRLVGFGGGKIDGVIANGFEYEVSQTEKSLATLENAMGQQASAILSGPLGGFIAPKKQRTTVKSFAWRKVDFSGLLSWGLRGETPPMTTKELIDLGEIEAADMESYVNGKRAAFIEDASVAKAEFTGLIPSNVRADMKGVIYDFTAYVPAEEAEALKALKDLGLDHVPGDGFFEWIWDPDKGDAHLDYVANTEGFADFSLGFELSAVKLKELAAAKAAGEKNAVAAVGAVDKFTARVADENALDAIFAVAALQMGGTAKDLRDSTPALIRLTGLSAGQMNPRIPGYVNALADFVADGGQLEITAAPAAPVAFKTLQEASATAPETLPDVMNLTVVHTGPGE